MSTSLDSLDTMMYVRFVKNCNINTKSQLNLICNRICIMKDMYINSNAIRKQFLLTKLQELTNFFCHIYEKKSIHQFKVE